MDAAPEKIESTAFDWRLYAEATSAGLSALLPLPFFDIAFEAYFRRRMPRTTAKVRRQPVASEAHRELGRGSDALVSLEGCLKIPIVLVRYGMRRLWRKFIYIFAIADATRQVSEYWHRAYLLDHIIRAGHVAPNVDWPRSTEVFEKVLRETDVSPLMNLARQTVSSAGRVMRMLFRALRLDAAEETESISAILRSHWDAAEASLKEVALRYNAEYARSLEIAPPAGTAERPRQPEPDAT